LENRHRTVSPSPDPNAVTPKAVAGTLNALRTASKQSLKRFVLTSSSAAALLARQNERGIIVEKGKQLRLAYPKSN
jgi:nucleoside-diphosphate-sugar epimerase